MSRAADDGDAGELAPGKRAMLRHAVATLAYRGSKAIRGAPPEFATFRASGSIRTPLQLVAHLGDLFDWGLSLAEGDQRWNVATPGSWDDECARFFATLERFDEYLASDRPLGKPAERLMQGPVADALTHVGQLTMLRRLAETPVRSENFAVADIVAGRVTLDQTAPKYEFD
ncbi:MAG TPA: hypothetical protein VM076_06945 [Gemmatimonadaceae bacterium]|nr:hypothetical protein [Gemmatimonadaceae bacterium]